MSNGYLDIARQGENNWWRYLLGTIIIAFFWLVIGSIVLAIFIFSPSINNGLNPSDFLRKPSIPGYLIINLQFIFFLLGIFLAIKWLHKRPFLTLVSADAAIKWQRFYQGLAVWYLIQSILFGIDYILAPRNLEFTYTSRIWIKY